MRMRKRARKSAARSGARVPLLVSSIVHAVLVILLVRFATVGADEPRKPGRFTTRVRTVEPPLPERRDFDPPLPTPEEPSEATLTEAAPPETDLPEIPSEPFVDDGPAAILLSTPLERCMAAGLVGRRRAEPPPPARRAAPVRVARKRPAGPSRRAAPDPGNVPPRYPKLAEDRGIAGAVLLRVVVSPEGEVISVAVRESSGHALLDREAVRAVLRWRFRPALREGVPVVAAVEVPIRFEAG
jgi:TonB family protein